METVVTGVEFHPTLSRDRGSLLFVCDLPENRTPAVRQSLSIVFGHLAQRAEHVHLGFNFAVYVDGGVDKWGELTADAVNTMLAEFTYCRYISPGNVRGELLLWLGFTHNSTHRQYMSELFPGLCAVQPAVAPYDDKVLSVMAPDPALYERLLGGMLNGTEGEGNNLLNRLMQQCRMQL